MMIPIYRLALAVSALLVLAGCDRTLTNSPISPSPVGELRLVNVAASASVADSQGTLREEEAPDPDGGPEIEAEGNPTVINGGTMLVTVSSAELFRTIYVRVHGKAAGLAVEATGGIGGHYEINLPSAQRTAGVLLTFPQDVPLSEFELLFAVADPAGAVGPYVGLPTTVTPVGTGDVQVTLSWDVDSDVDVHVIGPDGEEIYYGNRESATGGKLDLDSNAACRIDGVRNENVTWPVGTAPRGQYTVRVDYWDSCGVSRTNYTVRISNGGEGQIIRGSFTGLGDQGGAGDGVTVATFERTTGPSVATAASAPAAPARARSSKTRGSGPVPAE